MQLHKLAPLALALVTASLIDAKKGCTTHYIRGKGTTTKYAPAVTSTITVNVDAIATSTAIVTGNVQTVTTAALASSTSTVLGKGLTDTFTSVSTFFKFVVPSTTVIAPIYTTTSTSISTSLLPASTSTSTTYTVPPSSPTNMPLTTTTETVTASTATSTTTPVPRKREGAIEERKYRNILPQKRKSPSNRKVVNCTPVVDFFTTGASGATTTTVTFTSTVYPTVTSTQTLTAIVTSTAVPNNVREVVTMSTTSTAMADTLTFTTTPTQVATTVVPLLLTPTATVVKSLVSICDPQVVKTKKASQYNFNSDSGQTNFYFPEQVDEASCCSAAAMISGAYAYVFSPILGGGASGVSTAGLCAAGYQTDASIPDDVCGVSGTIYGFSDTTAPDNNLSIGMLQCGTDFDITPGNYPINFYY